MNNGKVDWQGVFPAVITPFTQDGAIDDRKFCDLLELLISEGINGAVLGGCTGESWALTGDERMHITKLALDVAKKRIPIIISTSEMVTQHTVDQSKRAKELGAQGVMVLPPFFAKVNRREVTHHYKRVSDEARIPILMYNLPGRSGTNLTPDFLEELVELDWICGIKESHNDFPQFEATVKAVGERIQVFTGNSADRGLAAVLMGACGFVGAFEPQIMGREGVALYTLAKKGDVAAASRVQRRTMAMNEGVRKIGSAPANLKAALNMMGRHGGYPRSPVLELTDDEKNRLRAVLDGLGLLKREAAE
jgi:4-hydroxy-tetrahydrodipicolinate synthase